jgi:hypothetical protein
MSNLLYGSSNVYRHYKSGLEHGLFSSHPLQLIQCTKKTLFDAHVSSLTGLNLMVTSVLENFIVDACAGVPDDEIPHFAHQQITAHVETIMAASVKFPEANFIVVPPLCRGVPGWFGPHLPGMLAHLAAEVARVQSAHLGCTTPFVVLPTMLDSDGVHLTPTAGDQFLRHLDAGIAGLLVPAIPPQEVEGSMTLERLAGLVASNANRIGELSVMTRDFKKQVRLRQQHDDLIFARMKEESDTEINRSREDRVCITGLASPPGDATVYKDQKAHYVAAVSRLVLLSCIDMPVQPIVRDVYVNLRKTQAQHLIEVKFDCPTNATGFRLKAVQLAKDKHAEFSELFFANSVTQATKVRIQILRILATMLDTETEMAFVQSFVSRPVLHYRARLNCRSTASGLGRSYTFVDAMSRFGTRLKPKDLISAYARAGNTFAGALSQYFVVLHDSDQPSSTRDGTYRAPSRGRASKASARAPAESTSGLRPGKRHGEPLVGTPSKKTEKTEKIKNNKSVKIVDSVEVEDEEETNAMD